MKVIVTLNQVQFGVFKKAIDLIARVRRGDTFAILSPLTGKEFDREMASWVCQKIRENIYPDLQPFELYCISDERIGKYGQLAVSILQKLPETCETDLCDIEIDMHEAYLSIEALDIYSRIKMAQIGGLRHELFGIVPESKHSVLDSLLRELNGVIYPEFTGERYRCYYGIDDKKVGDGREAFDIQQVIRHALAWKRFPKGGITVDFHEPMKWGDQPLPKIRIEDDGTCQ